MSELAGMYADVRDAQRRVAALERDSGKRMLRIASPQFGVSIPWQYQFIHLGYLWETRQVPAVAGSPWQWRIWKYDGTPVTFTVDDGWFPVGTTGRDMANGNVTFGSPLDLAVTNPQAWRSLAIYSNAGTQVGSTFTPSMTYTDWPPVPEELDGFGYLYVYNGKSWVIPSVTVLGGSWAYPAKVYSNAGAEIHSFVNHLSWDREYYTDHHNGNSQGQGTNAAYNPATNHILFYRTSETGALISTTDLGVSSGAIQTPTFDGVGYVELLTHVTGVWTFWVFDENGATRQMPETMQPTYAPQNLIADGYIWKFRVNITYDPLTLTRTWTCDTIDGRTCSMEPPLPLWDWTTLGTEHGRLWLVNGLTVKVYDSTGSNTATFTITGKYLDNGSGYNGLVFDRAGYLWDISLTTKRVEVWNHEGTLVGTMAI